ncbi:MAG TPA: hypothetical protein VF876_12240 [Burkholderiales bacterium]
MRTIASLAAAVAAASAFAATPALAQQKPDPKLIQEIYDCLAVGLPKDWKKAWMTVTQVGGTTAQVEFEGRFFYATSPTDTAGKPLSTCGAKNIAQSVAALRAGQAADQRGWKGLKLTFSSDGKFDLYFDYGK